MFLFALPLFETGLLIIIVILMLLYLIVIIKLKPSTEGEKILKAGSLKQNIQKTKILRAGSPKKSYHIRKAFSTERWNKPAIPYKTREEPAERVKAIEEPAETVKAIEEPKPPKVPVETEKTVVSRDTRPSGCPHHFGYLRDHPKKTPIPNECLTCTKIMGCLVGVE